MTMAKMTYAHCFIRTNLPGMTCPLCRVALQPNVGHACAKSEDVKRIKKKATK